MKHSSVVGGSTAKRVINCPGSVKLVDLMPPKPSSKYADEGTLCHTAIDLILNGKEPQSLLGMKYEDEFITQELLNEKIYSAYQLLNEIDPTNEMDYITEMRVHFGDFLPNVFGSADMLGRIKNRAVVVDFKFGSGVAVDAEENDQLMFYAAAAMRTPNIEWVFQDADEIELVIIQPPYVRRWVTTVERIKQFELALVQAVKLASQDDAPMKSGDHCRWCAAKPTCPIMTGAVDRVIHTKLDALDVSQLSEYLQKAEMLEQWITDARALAFEILDAGKPLPGYKLVAKRATRQWVDENKALVAMLNMGVQESELTETSVISPAKAEKVLKKHKLALPEGEVVAISSGSTLAAESDPRPAVLQIGQQLTVALSKIQ